MSVSEAPINPEGSRLHDRKLVSWKEIAVHLGREIRTVQRWEKTEGLPVRRHEHQKRSTVYAYASELDEWFKKRQPADDPEADAAFEPEPDVADVSPTSDNGSGNLATQATTIAENESADSRDQVNPPSPRWKQPGIVLGTTVVILIAVYAALNWIPPGLFTQKKIRLVVIPFANLSGDPKQDYFSAGLTDEMIPRLGSLEPQRLGVIAATSSNALAGKPIAEIGHALDVQYALEGSVRRDGNHVRIDVQLIQVSDQTQLWADSYDRDLNDILSVQDDVGTAVASQTRLALNPSSAKGSGPATKRIVNPEAYDAYLRGRLDRKS